MPFRKLCAIICLLSFYSCKKAPDYQVPKEIEPYIQKFVSEARKRGVKVDINRLIISYNNNITDEEGTRANGKCVRSFLNWKPTHIQLDTTLGWWHGITHPSKWVYNVYAGNFYKLNYPASGLISKDMVDLKTNLSRERVIFHELAHALLNREHTQDTLPNGFDASLMAPSSPATYVHFPQGREYYLDELFRQQTVVPCWAYDAPVTNIPIETLDSLLPLYSQTAFTHVMQNTLGEIWLFGQEGLCQYKGKNKVALYNRSNFNLPADAAFFRSDKNGNCWVWTHSKQLLYRQERGFNPFPLKGLKLSELVITDFAFDTNNTLWLATEQGLIRYTNEHSFKVYNTSNTNLPHSYIQKLNMDKKNRLWVIYGNGGIAMMENEHSFAVYNEVAYHSPGIFSPDACFIAIDKNNVPWTLTNKGELFKLNQLSREFQPVHVLDCAYPDVYVTALQSDKSGNIWIGYLKGITTGIARQQQNGLFIAYPLSRNRQVKDIFVTNENELIHEIEFDTSGNVWVGGSSGILKVNFAVQP